MPEAVVEVVVEAVEVVEVAVVALHQFGLACCTWRWYPGSCLVSWDPRLALPSSVHSAADPNPALVLPFPLCLPACLPLPFHLVLLLVLLPLLVHLHHPL